MLGAIWAQSLDGVIGDGTGMPWHVPEDLAHFKKVTLTHPVLMGRRTWESLPPRFRPLPGRDNIIVSQRPAGTWSAGATVLADPTRIADYSGWIIGGGQLYAAALALVTRIEVTLIDAHLTPQLDKPVMAPTVPDTFTVTEDSRWRVSQSGRIDSGGECVRYRFLSYRRKDD